MTNKMAEVFLKAVTSYMESAECKLQSVVLKGIQNRFCPLMQRDTKKRPCKMSREFILRSVSTLFASHCPLETYSVEANAFSATAIIELVQNVSARHFPKLRLLNIDGMYNESAAIGRMIHRQQLQF